MPKNYSLKIENPAIKTSANKEFIFFFVLFFKDYHH